MSTPSINLGHGKQIVGGKVVVTPTNPDNRNRTNKLKQTPKAESQKPQASKTSNLTKNPNNLHLNSNNLCNPTFQLAASTSTSIAVKSTIHLHDKLNTVLEIIESLSSSSWHIIDGKQFIFYRQNDTSLCVFFSILNAFQIPSLNQLKIYLSTADKAYQKKLAKCLQNAILNGIHSEDEIEIINQFKNNIKNNIKNKYIQKAYLMYMIDKDNISQHALCAIKNEEIFVILDSNQSNIMTHPNLPSILNKYSNTSSEQCTWIQKDDTKKLISVFGKEWMANNKKLSIKPVY